MVRRLEARLEARAAGAQATQSDTDAELAIGASWIAASRALRAGMQAPSLALADGKGTTFALEDALRAAPVVLHFFRGCGCSFGEESVAGFFLATQQAVRALGASAVAVALNALSALQARAARRTRT